MRTKNGLIRQNRADRIICLVNELENESLAWHKRRQIHGGLKILASQLRFDTPDKQGETEPRTTENGQSRIGPFDYGEELRARKMPHQGETEPRSTQNGRSRKSMVDHGEPQDAPKMPQRCIAEIRWIRWLGCGND